MVRKDLAAAFASLSTPLVADACVRLKCDARFAPHDVRPLVAGMRAAGKVLPARHYGSVDVFLEAMASASPGNVLVIDNGGRKDEACIGDLTVLEAKANGLSGMVVWGLHRDSEELLKIGLPVFSQGACPSGPRRLDLREPEALSSARIGDFSVGTEDVAFADDDGVLFIDGKDADKVLEAALAISKTERKQADAIRNGKRLAEQLRFDEYLVRHAADPSYSFRKHLHAMGGAVEE